MPRALLFVIIGVSVAMSLVAAYHRLPWCDEGWMANPAHNLASHGVMGTTTFPRYTQQAERMYAHTYWVLPGMIVGLAGWYTFAPATLMWTRVFSILWAPLLLLSVFQIVRRVTRDEPAALLAAGLLGVDFVLVSNAGFGRPDVMCAALGFAGTASYLTLRHKSITPALAASNALVMLSGLVHPNGLLHFVALWIVIVWYDRHSLSLRAIAPAIVVYVLGGAAWGAYVSQDPQACAAQIKRNALGNERYATTLNPARLVWNELRERYVYGLGFNSPRLGARLKAATILAAMVAAVLIAFWRKLRARPGVNLLLVLLGACFILQCVFNQKLHYYLVHILPYYMALLAVLMVWIARTYPRLRAPIVALAGGLVVIQFSLLAAVATVRSTRADEMQLAAFVRPRLAEMDRVFGSAALSFDLNFDHRLVDDAFIGSRSNETAGMIIFDPNYKVRWDLYREKYPALMRGIERTLAEYDKVFENESYRVYIRR